MIVLTSFKKSTNWLWPKFSAAVYQPKNFNYPKVAAFDIRRPDGEWVRPRLFVNEPKPLVAYRDALLSIYEARRLAIEVWANSLIDIGGKAVLCCWCPYDEAAQRQLKEHGTFVCHTDVMRIMLSRIGLRTTLDKDREKMVNLEEVG